LKTNGRFLRLNTNGHGSQVNKFDLPPKLVGLIDKVSVSLNSPDAQTYVKLSRPDRKEDAYLAMVDFIKSCVANGIPTEASVVNLPGVDIDGSRQLAQKLGASFRLREYVPGDA
jgi:TatD DNase family protein